MIALTPDIQNMFSSYPQLGGKVGISFTMSAKIYSIAGKKIFLPLNQEYSWDLIFLEHDEYKSLLVELNLKQEEFVLVINTLRQLNKLLFRQPGNYVVTPEGIKKDLRLGLD